jgi:hypothetical protein
LASGLFAVPIEVPQPLVRLAARLLGVAELVAARQPSPCFDLYCPLLSLRPPSGPLLAEAENGDNAHMDAPKRAGEASH